MNIPRTLGPYAVEGQIGSGGMATVLAGRHRYLDRLVALKVRRRTEDEQEGLMADRFRLGAFMQARLEHEQIARVFDYLESSKLQVIVMEYLGGGSIEDHLSSRQGPLGIDESLCICIKAAEGLEYAHEQGVVHRDIKPGNIMLFDDEVPDSVRLTDFGVAKNVGHNHNLTMAGANVGTLWYMPPEQFNNEAPTPLVDVYALGATLYEMITGHIPFRAAQHAELFRRFLDGEPPPDIRERNPEVPESLAQVVLWALALEADQRLPTSQAFAGLLRAVAASRGRFADVHPIIARGRARLSAAEMLLEQLPEAARADVQAGLRRLDHRVALPAEIGGTQAMPVVDDSDELTGMTLPPDAFAALNSDLLIGQDTAPPYDEEDEDRTMIMDVPVEDE